MSKRLNSLQTFYIDNNLGLTDIELAKTTGATLRQVKTRRTKIIGKNREGNLKGEPETKILKQADPTRQVELENEAQKAAALQPSVDPAVLAKRPAPNMRIDALLSRKSGTVALTQAASELADTFDGIAPGSQPVRTPDDPFADTTKVHRIR